MILILGAKGMLGGQLAEVFGAEATAWDREDIDVTQTQELRQKIYALKPSWVINCVAYNDVDGAEKNSALAFKLNAEVVGDLAKICSELYIPLMHFSTNYVFDGKLGVYDEKEKPNPLSEYAKSKYEGERLLQKNCKDYYLVRTSVVFGPKAKSASSKKSFVELMLHLSENTQDIKAVTDEINSVTYAKDLAESVKYIVGKKLPYGVYHITNSGQASWYEFAKEIFNIKNILVNLIPVSASEFKRPALRPTKSVLINTKIPKLRSWQEALREFLTSSLPK